MDKQTKKGILITFEGIDGSGKSSAARAVSDMLSSDWPVVLTREPGATQLGTFVRNLLQNRTFNLDAKSEFLLFAADRAQHFSELVLPALTAGKVVLSDRMADSSYAYQGYGRGLDPQMIASVNEWAMQGYEPDLTIYLTIDYESASARLTQRDEKKTVFEKEQKEFFDRVAQGFEAAFKQRHKGQIARVDATLAPQQLYETIVQEITQFLSARKSYESSPSISVDRA